MRFLELKIPPLLLVPIFIVDMLILRWLFPRPEFNFEGQQELSFLLLGTGILLPVLGFIAFQKAKTTVHPQHPEETSALVRGGVYQYTRNPMYLGFLLVLVAAALYLGNVWSACMVPLFVWYMNQFQIIPEERILTEKFGDDFRAYLKQTRRWL
ncbi:methyltransferase family protein [Aliidiomarina sanyensis]|uniref:Isoprenylcysteine carboxylmethyltransferase family protein n=1 Tax=Aliidiomarina sanyensis TaxID=1249555 RepID=A0A432WB26_9GAMM|nr:isoprenylcysteine carboxylmethyltransferase family protein [Aliidiomarina sanyensis]RUO27447.1 isoprenylcysteine carboxylmethyltransferase family protein [Aliidiomarina sanyensis]